MIQGIVFDMDGVLVASEQFYEQRRNDYLCKSGIAPWKGQSFTGSNERAIWETIIPHDLELRERLKLGYREYRKQHPLCYEELINPQVFTVFSLLKKNGLKVAIASSSDRGSIAFMMQAAGVVDLVDYYISGEECSAHKPNPEIYRRALEALQLTPENALAVEDSPLGIAAAKNAGLTVYALRPEEGVLLDQSAADGILDRLDQIVQYI